VLVPLKTFDAGPAPIKSTFSKFSDMKVEVLMSPSRNYYICSNFIINYLR
jgi:hypothetical protein